MATAVYATIADFEGYVEGWVTDNPAALQRTLDRAERDVNSYLKWTRFPYTAPQFVLLAAEYQAGLRNAVCAQAEYRLLMGEEFFVETSTPVSGPDYSSTRAPARFGPKARQELLDAEIISLTGPMGRRVPAVTPQRRFSDGRY